MKWQVSITKPRAADGKWHWVLQYDLEGRHPQWHRVTPINKDHPTSGSANTRQQALAEAGDAKRFYERQLEHEQLPPSEVVTLT